MVRETLPVLYRDATLVAVHKPSGLLVHRSMIDRHETRFALQIVRDQIGQRVWPVHRLDKGTSGVLLFALDETTARRLGDSFDRGVVDKRYLAVVRGWMPEAGEIDHPLRRLDDAYGRGDAPSRRESGVGENFLQAEGAPVGQVPAVDVPLAQTALTRYRRLAVAEIAERVEPTQRFPTSRYSLVELNPVTGRQHQLRRHLKHLSHPIIGDATYGKGIHNRFIAARYGVGRLMLACLSMHLAHPEDGRPLALAAPLAEDYQRVLAGFGWAEWIDRAGLSDP